MIYSFIKRRIWLLKSRPFVIIGIIFGLPALTFLFFYTQPVFKTAIYSNLHSPEWLMYFCFVIGAIILYININYDIQEYRFNNPKIFQLILSPVSPRKIIFYLVSAVAVESFIITSISGVILTVVTGIHLSFNLVFYGMLSLLIFLLLLGSLFTTVSLLSEDNFLYSIVSICTLLICIAAPGIGILNLNVSNPFNLWQYLPTTMVLNFLFFIVLAELKRWSLFIIPLLLTVILFIINGEIIQRIVRK